MLFCLNKHFIKNYKNILISQYNLNKKQINFKKKININIAYTKNNFFLASFLLNTFSNNLIKKNIKNYKLNLFLPIFNFFFIFTNIIYPYLNNLKYIKKKSKNLIFLNFEISNFLFNPFFNIKFKNYLNNKNNIFLKIQLDFKKKNLNYIQFFFNFFQIPLLKK